MSLPSSSTLKRKVNHSVPRPATTGESDVVVVREDADLSVNPRLKRQKKAPKEPATQASNAKPVKVVCIFGVRIIFVLKDLIYLCVKSQRRSKRTEAQASTSDPAKVVCVFHVQLIFSRGSYGTVSSLKEETTEILKQKPFVMSIQSFSRRQMLSKYNMIQQACKECLQNYYL